MKEENYIPNDEPLLRVEQKLDNVREKFEQNTLAMEMLKELKKTSKRWFIAFIVVLIMLFATNIGWLIYESQFETVLETEETTTQYVEDIDTPTNTNFTQTIN